MKDSSTGPKPKKRMLGLMCLDQSPHELDSLTGFDDRPRKREKSTWVLLRVVNSDLLRYVDPLYIYISIYIYNIQKVHVHEYMYVFFIDVVNFSTYVRNVHLIYLTAVL